MPLFLKDFARFLEFRRDIKSLLFYVPRFWDIVYCMRIGGNEIFSSMVDRNNDVLNLLLSYKFVRL